MVFQSAGPRCGLHIADERLAAYIVGFRTSLGRRDSNLCISKSDLLNFIPPQQDLGIDRARPKFGMRKLRSPASAAFVAGAGSRDSIADGPPALTPPQRWPPSIGTCPPSVGISGRFALEYATCEPSFLRRRSIAHHGLDVFRDHLAHPKLKVIPAPPCPPPHRLPDYADGGADSPIRRAPVAVSLLEPRLSAASLR